MTLETSLHQAEQDRSRRSEPSLPTRRSTAESTAPAARPAPYRVLVVCRANVYRSPLGEIILRSTAAAALGPASFDLFDFSSAGMRAVGRTGIHPDVEQVLKERGLEDRPTPPRQITPAAIESADLILASDRAQRAEIVAAVPAALHRTFTLPQFAELCAAGRDDATSAPASGQDLERLVANGRSRRVSSISATDAIPDPVDRGVEAVREAADLIEACAAKIFA